MGDLIGLETKMLSITWQEKPQLPLSSLNITVCRSAEQTRVRSTSVLSVGRVMTTVKVDKHIVPAVLLIELVTHFYIRYTAGLWRTIPITSSSTLPWIFLWKTVNAEVFWHSVLKMEPCIEFVLKTLF